MYDILDYYRDNLPRPVLWMLKAFEVLFIVGVVIALILKFAL